MGSLLQPLRSWTRLGVTSSIKKCMGPEACSLSFPLITTSGYWIPFWVLIVMQEFPFNKEHLIIPYSKLVWNYLIRIPPPASDMLLFIWRLPEPPPHTMLQLYQPGMFGLLGLWLSPPQPTILLRTHDWGEALGFFLILANKLSLCTELL